MHEIQTGSSQRIDGNVTGILPWFWHFRLFAVIVISYLHWSYYWRLKCWVFINTELVRPHLDSAAVQVFNPFCDKDKFLLWLVQRRATWLIPSRWCNLPCHDGDCPIFQHPYVRTVSIFMCHWVVGIYRGVGSKPVLEWVSEYRAVTVMIGLNDEGLLLYLS